MTARRHLSRQMALQVLYARHFLVKPPEEIVDLLAETGEVTRKNWTRFARGLVDQAIQREPELDERIVEALEHWRIERLSRIDLVTLRLALCEMLVFDDIPVRVTINEYIEVAKMFGTEDSAAFVNGILDRLARAFGHKDYEQKRAARKE